MEREPYSNKIYEILVQIVWPIVFAKTVRATASSNTYSRYIIAYAHCGAVSHAHHVRIYILFVANTRLKGTKDKMFIGK